MNSHHKPIAIVGVGAILPDAFNVTDFWNNLIAGRYSITETPGDRWSILDYYDPDPNAPDKTYSKIGGWVRGFEFDWKKFKIPPRVAQAMDIGQQWAVTIAAQALEDYGYPRRPLDTERTGVVLGTAMGGELHYLTTQRIVFPEYAHALQAAPAYQQLPAAVRAQILDEFHAVIDHRVPPITEDSMPGELPNIVSGRVANVLNLRGPNFITDAACASSLAALDAAWELLSNHKADAVLTGGVDRNMGIGSFVKFCKIGALSATGTRPFGKGADGFVMGEGSAAFLVKRLEDAERDGDKIYAVVRGVGGSSDGKGKGITAPNPIGQQLSTRRAWENAELDPASAVMIEAHGTSTRVGDVVEVDSLQTIFGAAPKNSIALGSVKSNIGHLKAGAGAAGLLKAVLSIHHSIIPPTLHAEIPNPDIPFEQTPFSLVNQPRAMERRDKNTPRRVGVSAYGFGGTNFHVVLEEHVEGMLTTASKQWAVNSNQLSVDSNQSPVSSLQSPLPPRGIFVIGAPSVNELKNKLDEIFARVQNGFTPEIALPNLEELKQRERIVIDFGSREELAERIDKARKAMAFDNAQAWKAMQAQGIFRGSGDAPGKIAFLFPGQGSQYLNMGRELAALYPTISQVFDDADAVMKPILGKPLTSYIFVESTDANVLKGAEKELQQTAITQPAMLTLDTAIYKLLAEFGFKPDMVMGHSLGEYAALIASGIMPFADALEASAARGAEMTKVSVAKGDFGSDNGWMAAVMAPYSVVEQTLQEIDGYVVAANINGPNQSVIGGESKAVEKAIEVFTRKGYQAQRLPVSHAFHTKIVAPASKPLRQVLNRLHISEPTLPLVANVTGEFYPTTIEAIKDVLELQIASPVQWVQGVQTLYNAGVRTFVEVGPKKALKGLVDDILADKNDVVSLFSNHPKTGELQSFNHALCGLYAAGYGKETRDRGIETRDWRLEIDKTPSVSVSQEGEEQMKQTITSSSENGNITVKALEQIISQLANLQSPISNLPYDRNETPRGSIVITGTGLGLPGAEKAVMAQDNALRILRGEQFVDLIPERFRNAMAEKRVTRLVKSKDGSGHFETITNPGEVIKLAGRPGKFDLADEYGVPEKLVEALDVTTQLAMAAGLDALREAGIPLVQTYRKTSKGTYLPERWLLPEALRDETGVIFASAFPGGDRFADEFSKYYAWRGLEEKLTTLRELRDVTDNENTLREIDARINAVREEMARQPYEFDRRFLFRILAMGHSQFAEYIGARGPNTQVNAACASTTQAIALAEDWIRDGRARRVIVIAADDVTGNNLMEWVGAGFLATGAAATDDRVEEAALPFDKRRHGTLLGMGACALVVESQDAAQERGMRGIVELLASETANSAYHGTRLDVNHIALVMNHLVSAAERRFGLNRYAIAPQTVFMSHETFTPARGGSASAEVIALRETFGDAASEIIVANTKGFTGHPMGVGIEDAIAVKILEHGIVPPVPNYKEVDEELGRLNLSRGGRYNVNYALHLAAGFGSQISMTLTRRIPGAMNRIDNPDLYNKWLADVSGYDFAETEIVKRNLRIIAQGAPKRVPAPSAWQYGTGPNVRVASVASEQYAVISNQMPVVRPLPKIEPIAPKVKVISPTVEPRVEPVAVKQEIAAPKAEPMIVKENGHEQSSTESPNHLITQSPITDPVIEKVLDIVAAKTGYPREMLDLDLDMEADLVIDTVKQAETFAALREEFSIPRQDNLKLRDYATLRRAVDFVKQFRPDLGMQVETEIGKQVDKEIGKQVEAETEMQSPVSSHQSPNHSITQSPIADKVLEIVAAKTGYPREMLDLDLDLEADLGIDTVKQAETFAAIREAFDIPRVENLKLRDYPTLKAVIGFVETMRPDLAGASSRGVTESAPIPSAARENASAAQASAQEPRRVPEPASEPAPSAFNGGDEITAKVLDIVAAKTGYPQEMLELDADLEADLGVDTVKQAETFAAVREAFDIPRIENLKLRDYPTLKAVIGFVRANKVEAGKQGDRESGKQGYTETGNQSSVISEQSPVSNLQSPNHPITQSPIKSIGTLEDADRIPRRVPTPTLRPPLDWCKATGVTLDENSRVLVMMDKGGVGRSLVSRLEKRGVTTLVIDDGLETETLDARVKAWLSEGAIQGVYWLSALDVEPSIDEMDLATWRELNGVRVKNLYTTMRALYESINAKNTFLVSATRLGGLHGYDIGGASAPLGGAVVGFTKAYKRERNDVLVKALDFEISRKTAEFADALIDETLFDAGVVEVGYRDGKRFSITLVDTSNVPNDTGMELNKETVFVITGAAGGITSAITTDLAVHSGGIFYLLDLVAPPNAEDAHIKLFRENKDALKAKLIADAKSAGEKPTPALIDKKILGIERQEAALRAKESVEAAGGVAHFYAGDLRDYDAVEKVMNEIRARHNKIDVIVHAAGLEISRSLADKDAAQFNLVFDVKADGFFNLLRAAKGIKIGATVVFSSVAGRFGNSGQTDYSAANDLLCKVTSSLKNWRPETRGIAIDWTAWGGIGMATRGSIPKIMEMAGIDMLPAESGVPTVRRELTYNDFRGEIVVGQRLGILAQEFDETGGLETEQVSQWLETQRPRLAQIGTVVAAKLYGGIEVETTLDPNAEPYLFDHQLENVPLLPGVMGTETFAELAQLLAPDFHVAQVMNEQFERPFKFHRMQPQTLYLSAWAEPTREGELVAHTTLKSITQMPRAEMPPQEKIHFTADVLLTRDEIEKPNIEFTAPAANTLNITAEQIYKIYFHGPAYKVLKRVQVDGDTAIAEMKMNLPADTSQGEGEWLIAPRLVEFCFQTAGIWDIKTHGVMALPMAIGSVSAYRQLREADGKKLYAVVNALDDGKAFDAQVVDETGAVYVKLFGYRTVQLPGKVTL
ncbi:MAG: beta-ketoacyl synthase [Chloroflexi bacterium UTCFX4]|jgi:malonyl CoA-acyl carrier protein transacylase|nr:MAG: beta-ketoacyl synthase [Chloroflexi bacterium UTCFX4]